MTEINRTTDYEQIEILSTALAHVCEGQSVRVLIPALSQVLIDAVMTSRCSLAGVEAFIELLRDDLRTTWLQARGQADGEGGGEEPPAA